MFGIPILPILFILSQSCGASIMNHYTSMEPVGCSTIFVGCGAVCRGARPGTGTRVLR